MADYKIIGEERTQGHCLECGAVIYGGRSDRKYCCDYCKNRHNNRKGHEIRNLKLRVSTILDKNYEILSSLLKEDLHAADRSELALRGYNAEYMTAHTRLARHDRCCCYDISFYLTPTRICRITRLKAGEYPARNE